MSKSIERKQPLRLLCGLGVLAALGLTGCQSDYGGQTLPSAYYLGDDVQYFPPGPEFKLTREAAELRAATLGRPRPRPLVPAGPGAVAPGVQPPPNVPGGAVVPPAGAPPAAVPPAAVPPAAPPEPGEPPADVPPAEAPPMAPAEDNPFDVPAAEPNA